MQTRQAYVRMRNKFSKFKTYVNADQLSNTIDRSYEILSAISNVRKKSIPRRQASAKSPEPKAPLPNVASYHLAKQNSLKTNSNTRKREKKRSASNTVVLSRQLPQARNVGEPIGSSGMIKQIGTAK